MPIKFLLLGGGVLGFSRRGGWKCQFYFYGRGDFVLFFFKEKESGSFARGRCRRGRSEIPHFCSKLLQKCPCPLGEAEKSEEKGEDASKKGKDASKKGKNA